MNQYKPFKTKQVINHKDCCTSNNSLSNLERCSYSHNNRYSYSHGTNSNVGERNRNARFTDAQVVTYRKQFKKNKITMEKIAEETGAHPVTVRYMLERKYYTHI